MIHQLSGKRRPVLEVDPAAFTASAIPGLGLSFVEEAGLGVDDLDQDSVGIARQQIAVDLDHLVTGGSQFRSGRFEIEVVDFETEVFEGAGGLVRCSGPLYGLGGSSKCLEIDQCLRLKAEESPPAAVERVVGRCRHDPEAEETLVERVRALDVGDA